LSYGFIIGKKDIEMAKVMWNGTMLAESDDYKVVEGTLYFPPDSVKKEYFRDSDTDYECPWKGHADYYDVVVGDKVNKDAAWYYPNPTPAAAQIKGHVAFDGSKGIVIEE
jgi:uncharacterized protein (DUF427 family)